MFRCWQCYFNEKCWPLPKPKIPELPPTALCRLPTADCRLPTADCSLPTAYCRLPTAHHARPERSSAHPQADDPARSAQAEATRPS